MRKPICNPPSIYGSLTFFRDPDGHDIEITEKGTSQILRLFSARGRFSKLPFHETVNLKWGCAPFHGERRAL